MGLHIWGRTTHIHACVFVSVGKKKEKKERKQREKARKEWKREKVERKSEKEISGVLPWDIQWTPARLAEWIWHQVLVFPLVYVYLTAKWKTENTYFARSNVVLFSFLLSLSSLSLSLSLYISMSLSLSLCFICILFIYLVCKFFFQLGHQDGSPQTGQRVCSWAQTGMNSSHPMLMNRIIKNLQQNKNNQTRFFCFVDADQRGWWDWRAHDPRHETSGEKQQKNQFFLVIVWVYCSLLLFYFWFFASLFQEREE